ncbi:helix-turn-helix domain-containing protein [Allomuricauda sp. SCSIO 65647]|uniref:helix-turn-helix domain-containing protein n=1 Tax=Allomuricauda sp. SCSIO 65647 TaxID=2908843 RepID=UPI001F2958F8|nr:AraC family transcriptional regulator [Muricauda sp. SCSIO 65647]UJH67952.1 AraC family transcriptional regulator [Muricauda sp. SCSIO 65647]
MTTKKLKAGTFMGQVQKMRALSGFTLSRTDHGQHMKVPKHEHEHPYISLLLHGLYHEQSIISEHDIKTGSSLFRPKGFEHKNEIGSHNSFCFNIEIEKGFPDKKHYSKIADYMQFERNNLEIYKIYFGFQNDFSDELLTLMVEENLHLLFQHQYAENVSGRAHWVGKIKKEIRFHPEKMYRIDEISHSVHLHPNYFVRKFKEKTGFTLGEFLLRQRISRGIDLMLHSSKPLTEIAVESGFYDQSHFIRHFRRFFGTTPSHYRAIVKG